MALRGQSLFMRCVSITTLRRTILTANINGCVYVIVTGELGDLNVAHKSQLLERLSKSPLGKLSLIIR